MSSLNRTEDDWDPLLASLFIYQRLRADALASDPVALDDAARVETLLIGVLDDFTASVADPNTQVHRGMREIADREIGRLIADLADDDSSRRYLDWARRRASDTGTQTTPFVDPMTAGAVVAGLVTASVVFLAGLEFDYSDTVKVENGETTTVRTRRLVFNGQRSFQALKEIGGSLRLSERGRALVDRLVDRLRLGPDVPSSEDASSAPTDGNGISDTDDDDE